MLAILGRGVPIGAVFPERHLKYGYDVSEVVTLTQDNYFVVDSGAGHVIGIGVPNKVNCDSGAFRNISEASLKICPYDYSSR